MKPFFPSHSQEIIITFEEGSHSRNKTAGQRKRQQRTSRVDITLTWMRLMHNINNNNNNRLPTQGESVLICAESHSPINSNALQFLSELGMQLVAMTRGVRASPFLFKRYFHCLIFYIFTVTCVITYNNNNNNNNKIIILELLSN